ncbi:MAG TPA: 6-phosphogluconolactonase [Pyrinomonadaceae bacterium]|jgi:6-phosphogluconolactonase|nr:6-phosphogluconolactonase [Pyrinomonadaceae bacterium]
MGIPFNVLVFETPEQLAAAAAERFVEQAAKLHGELELFSVALAGGRTPRRVYELLATERFKNRIEWSKAHLFFGDERCVPPIHPDSNYAMVYETLISKVAIPAKNVRRIIGEGEADANARSYENQLRIFFGGRAWPRFDLVLLGMGEDGHTASLFPRSTALQEKSRWVVATKNESTGQQRITLTLPVFNQAANVMFLVTGKEKAQRLAEVLHPKPGAELLPAEAIKPADGTLEWLVDAAAAACL